MKKSVILVLILMFSVAVMGQKTISNPKVILDTTLTVEGISTHFVFTWEDGYFLTQAVDSAKNDTVFNHNYFSLKHSNALFILTKKRIMGTDTIIRRESIQVPFTSIYTAMNALYTSATIKSRIRAGLVESYHKKISEE